MYKKGTGNDKQGKDAGNRTLCPYRNFSQAIMSHIDPQLDLDSKQEVIVNLQKLSASRPTDPNLMLVRTSLSGII